MSAPAGLWLHLQRSVPLLPACTLVDLGSEMKQSSPGQLGSPLLPQKRAGPSPPRLVPRDDGHHGQQEQVWPKLQLVDLAGSECVGEQAGSEGQAQAS